MRSSSGRVGKSSKVIDSFQLRRNYVRDSIAAVRKYHESKHYRDSVTRVRNIKAAALKSTKDTKTANTKKARDKKSQEISTVRLTKADSIKAIQKNKADSLARIKKYKASKRYADSTALAKRERADSIETVREHFRDSVANARKHSLDSSKLVRKKAMDSVKIVRKKAMDSVKLVRKTKADSLLKIKNDKEKLAKAKEKKKQEEQKLKLEIKFKQKREAWSNTVMLKKRWNLLRRIVQNSFTHYNYYYNANRKMDEAMANMQRTRKENYDSLINLYPFDPNKDSAMMAADMDSIIRKASIGLQIHDPREKWANDLYLLMGQAYYYKGKFENASTAFRYIINKDEENKKKEAMQNSRSGGGSSKSSLSIVEEENTSKLNFLKHKSVHNEAILWLARTYTSWHLVENAESVVSLLESDPHFPEDLRGRLAAEKAFAYLAEHNDQAAITQLNIVQDDNNLPDWLRMRAAFLNGQLLQSRGEYAAAVASFENVLDYFPKLEMDFYTRKLIAYNSLLAGDDASTAMRPLKKVLNDGKYVSYYDQVYFVLGKLAIKAGETDDAIDYLNKSIYTPKATKKQKALSFATLGDAYYAGAKYRDAKNAYDSAAKYNMGSKDTVGMANMQRSKLLNNIVEPATLIHDLDSLLALADLSKKEQLAAVRKYLKWLEKRQQDSTASAMTAGASTINLPESGSETSDMANWYFSNPTQIQQGSAEFKRKWGNRALTDNWRRASANAFSNSNSSSDELKETADNEKADNGLPTEKSLLAKIPSTQEKKDELINREQKAYIQLAKAYFNDFDDMTQTIATLDNLDTRFPNHNQKEEELYLRYQVAIKQNQLALAQTYSNELVKKYPKSLYASMLKPSENSKSEAQGNGMTVSKYYEETYNLLLTHQYTEALVHIDVAKRQYNNPVFKKRFQVAEAMALAGMGNLDKADTAVATFLLTYPATDTLSAWAKAIKDYISSVRKTGVPAWYKESPPGAATTKTVKTGDSTLDKAAGKIVEVSDKPAPKLDPPAMYQNKPTDEHYCIVILPGLDSRITTLKKKIKTFDSSNYTEKQFDIILDYFAYNQTVLVVKKFANAGAAKTFMNDLIASTLFGDFGSSDYKVVIISSANYLKLYADKKIASYLSFYDAVYH